MNLAAQFVVDVSVLTAVVGCLSCYHCISRIDADHADQTEKLALKTALFTRYNVPPSHEDCAGGSEDLMFRAVAKETCAQKDDQCVRIVSAVEETTPPVQLVMRGCLSTLFQPGFELSRQPNCSHFEESQCLCNTTLCNSAISPVNKLQIISALLLVCFSLTAQCYKLRSPVIRLSRSITRRYTIYTTGPYSTVHHDYSSSWRIMS